ncbi:hypothetical protein BDV12DRAFT_208901 [Aspergillus spectabilis]
MANLIYLITGANRGIGRALTKSLLARPSTTVIAAVRDPSSGSSTSLKSIPKGDGSCLVTVKIDSGSPPDVAIAVKTLESEYNMTHIDVVIANAGISENLSPMLSVSFEDIKEHIDVNTLGPLALFQATHLLLKQSKKPVFVGMGSGVGSIGGMEQRPFSTAAYGLSKVMLHYLVRKIHFENEDIVSFVMDPGFPKTEMGNRNAKFLGLEEAWHTVEESVNGVIRAIHGATRESVGGQLRVWDESYFPW